jgi:hypothetical protein
MAVSTTNTSVTYNGNGATTSFTVTFQFFSASDLVVIAISADGVETPQTLTTHYTVSGGSSGGVPSTGTVTMLTAPSAGTTLRIQRNTQKTQATTFANNDAFPAKTVEGAFDKLMLIAQEGAPGANDGIDGDVMRLETSGQQDHWDAQDFPIRNVTEPTDDDDAATKSYVDAKFAEGVLGEAYFIQAGTGAQERTFQSKLREWVTAADFGAVADGTSHPLSSVYATLGAAQAVYPHATALTDEIDWCAVQAALNYVQARSFGGLVRCGAGEYMINRPLTVVTGGGLVGDLTKHDDGITDFRGSGLYGPVIRVMGPHCVLRDFCVTATADRRLATRVTKSNYTGLGLTRDDFNFGIHIEAADTLGAAIDDQEISNVWVSTQPNDSFVLVGGTYGSRIERCGSRNPIGHGFVVTAGQYTARTNTVVPGVMKIEDCQSYGNTGHALMVGGPDNTGTPPVRVIVDNFDCYDSASNAALAVPQYVVFFYAENSCFNNGAVAGSSDVQGGIYLAGRNNRLNNNRYLNTSQPVLIENDAGADTRASGGLDIVGLLTTQATALVHTNAVAITGSVDGVRVYAGALDGNFSNVAPSTAMEAQKLSERYWSGSLVLNHNAQITIGGFTAPFQIHGVTVNNASQQIGNWANNTTPATLILAKSRGDAVGTQGLATSGTEAGAIDFNASDGTTMRRVARLVASVSAASGSGDMPGTLEEYTMDDGSTTETLRRRIDHTGQHTHFGPLHVRDGTIASVVGADSSARTLTNATNKAGRVGVPHYTNSEEPVGIFNVASQSASSILTIGGGSGLLNTITQGSLYAASGVTTTTGTEQVRWTNGAFYFPAIGTTASAANAFLDSGSSPVNQLLRSTSSGRYKREVEDIDPAYADAVLQLRPVWYRSKVAHDPQDWSWYGLIAEEVAKIDPRLVHWGYRDEDWEEVEVGTEIGPSIQRRLKEGAAKVPDGVQYERLSVLLLDCVRRLTERVYELERQTAI